MAERLRENVRAFWMLAAMWVRVDMTYRTSFLVLLLSSLVLTGIDFAAIGIMFANVDSLGGFGLGEIGFLYGGTAVALGTADLVVGNIERLGSRIRSGSLDAMMVRPVSLFVQTCADHFAFRRVGRILQGVAVLAWSLSVVPVHWTPLRVLMVPWIMVFGSLIFTALFVLGGAFQFVSVDGSEVANAFTYGGNTLTQYPLTIYPAEAVRALTFLVPVAFVNWYPSLYVLDRPDPLGLPTAAQFASPVAALVLCTLAALAWRAGVRRYRSTGS
ncbi:MAG: ABC transporter permease [Nocardioidaceae bacterium]